MVAFNERRNKQSNTKEKYPLKTRIIAAIGAAAAMGALGACSKTEAVGHTHLDSNDNVVTNVQLNEDGTVNDGKVVNIPAVTTDLNGDGKVTIEDVQKLSLEDASHVDPADLVQIFDNEYESYAQQTLDGAQQYLNADQKNVLTTTIDMNTPKENLSDQEVANSVTLGVMLSSLEQDPEYGKRMLYTFLDRNYPTVDEIRDKIKGNGYALTYVYKVNESKPITNGEFMGVKVSSNGRAFMMDYVPNNDGNDDNFNQKTIGVYDLVKSTDGKSSAWKLMTVTKLDADSELAYARIDQ